MVTRLVIAALALTLNQTDFRCKPSGKLLYPTSLIGSLLLDTLALKVDLLRPFVSTQIGFIFTSEMTGAFPDDGGSTSANQILLNRSLMGSAAAKFILLPSVEMLLKCILLNGFVPEINQGVWTIPKLSLSVPFVFMIN